MKPEVPGVHGCHSVRDLDLPNPGAEEVLQRSPDYLVAREVPKNYHATAVGAEGFPAPVFDQGFAAFTGYHRDVLLTPSLQAYTMIRIFARGFFEKSWLPPHP